MKNLKNESLATKRGVLVKYDEMKHRWEVLVDGKVKSIKAENLGKLFGLGL